MEDYAKKLEEHRMKLADNYDVVTYLFKTASTGNQKMIRILFYPSSEKELLIGSTYIDQVNCTNEITRAFKNGELPAIPLEKNDYLNLMIDYVETSFMPQEKRQKIDELFEKRVGPINSANKARILYQLLCSDTRDAQMAGRIISSNLKKSGVHINILSEMLIAIRLSIFINEIISFGTTSTTSKTITDEKITDEEVNDYVLLVETLCNEYKKGLEEAKNKTLGLHNKQ